MRPFRLIALIALALLSLRPAGALASSPGPRPDAGIVEAASEPFRYPSLFPPAPTVGPQARRIAVDLSRQQLTAFYGPTPVRAFAVATGDWEHPTIIGRYAVEEKYAAIDLIGPDYYYHAVPYVMMFAKPFYIHAAPWRTEFGVRASRGCVTLDTGDAAWLFRWAEVGTPIDIRW